LTSSPAHSFPTIWRPIVSIRVSEARGRAGFGEGEIRGAGVSIMTKEEEFERRLVAVEDAVADLQLRLKKMPDSEDWLYKVAGAITDVEGFKEVLEYGREFRYLDRPMDEDNEVP